MHLYRQCDDFHKKKNIYKIVQDQFLQPLKDHPCDMLEKLCLVFFSWDKKKSHNHLGPKKITQPLGTKKITKHLETKKSHATSWDKKIMQSLGTK